MQTCEGVLGPGERVVGGLGDLEGLCQRRGLRCPGLGLGEGCRKLCHRHEAVRARVARPVLLAQDTRLPRQLLFSIPLAIGYGLGDAERGVALKSQELPGLNQNPNSAHQS